VRVKTDVSWSVEAATGVGGTNGGAPLGAADASGLVLGLGSVPGWFIVA
jgi:hypothetical protein